MSCEKVKTTNIWAIRKYRIEVITIEYGAVASRLIFIVIIRGANGFVMALIIPGNFIIGTVRCTRSVWIQIDLIVNVALDEIGELRICFGSDEIIAGPYNLT